ncbi:CPX chromosomal region candidate gene 1 protein [Pteropus vampyrus]|uniref:CPX chromosomal region candidate gene 1 protein n=1 Tax=Pteropus vampyrus TaxID=132908 RepID=A0A6P6CIX6_PTEVA|nr:CPX chromosomal region candidate gene 1 protein [Pteropus vampyrus]
MTSPTKEGSDSSDFVLENSENEAPNDCSADVEPSFAESNMTSQVESNPMNRELDIPISQEHAVSQPAENNELEVEMDQNDPQEDLKEEESHLIQIPIPRNIDRKNPLIKRAKFYSGNMKKKTSNLCYTTINYKIPFQLSISWRIPFINSREIRRMTLRLLCGRYFSQAAGRQNTTWVKQKYIAFIENPNALLPEERAIIFGRPLRVYYYRPLIERMTSKKMSKSTETKEPEEFHIFVRPVFYVPQIKFESTFNRKAFEDHLRSHHNISVVIINTDDGWKYLCPICGICFNNLVEFRQHSCNSPEN